MHLDFKKEVILAADLNCVVEIVDCLRFELEHQSKYRVVSRTQPHRQSCSQRTLHIVVHTEPRSFGLGDADPSRCPGKVPHVDIRLVHLPHLNVMERKLLGTNFDDVGFAERLVELVGSAYSLNLPSLPRSRSSPSTVECLPECIHAQLSCSLRARKLLKLLLL
jgi:hypothetical protein